MKFRIISACMIETALKMSYNKGNQLTAMVNGKDKIAYTYDKNSSMVTKVLTSQAYAARFDAYAAPKSALGKAITYLKAQWPYLTNYLKDGRLELSNNRAERSIKPFVIDRKNFLFANTPKGAKGSAMMFSLIQTAIENGLDPYRYLTWLLKNANNADLTQAEEVQMYMNTKRNNTIHFSF